MENIRAALLRGVEACRELLKLHKVMEACGYVDTPFFNSYAIIADGIYALIGEHTETFAESITNLALNTPYLTNERRTEMLMAEYRKNFPEQPRPITSDKDNKKTNRTGYAVPQPSRTIV